MSETANLAPEEVGIKKKYGKHNKLRTILITLIIALVVFGAIYTMSRLLMIYKVTYVTYGGLVYGEEIEDAEYKYLAKTIEPVGLKKEGYYIEGYYLNSNMTSRYEFGTEIKNNIKLYVNWQPGYAVQLNLADGEEEWSNITLEYLKTYYEQYVEP
ncbi:MAG: InlB B-repeat-containing protein, partial [Christensenellales bacterium]